MTDEEIEEAIATILHGYTVGILCALPQTAKIIARRLIERTRSRLPENVEMLSVTDMGFATSAGGRLYVVVNMMTFEIDQLFLDAVMTKHLERIEQARARVRS